MSQKLRVALPPPRPLLVYDGECQFCCRWIARWHRATGDAVDYLPFQDESVARQFPEIPRHHFQGAVQLIQPDGSVYSAAEAVFRSLAAGGRARCLLWCYQRLPSFADAAEYLYTEVAGHREFLSKLDRWWCGGGTQPPSHARVRYLFLRGLAAIYLIAFASLWVQIHGLVGSHGIVPVHSVMNTIRADMDKEGIGLQRYHLFPTLAWWSDSDRSLDCQCAAGVACSLLLLAGIASAPALFLLWAIYLSLCTVAPPFMDFQWDILLLETGFLAIFLAPLRLIEKPSDPSEPSTLVVWLFRWLLFRLMFESGCVKLMSADDTWWGLTALRFHYQTQPLPTWIGWYAHQLPHSAQTASTLVMFAIELIAPAFIFAGRIPRLVAALAFTALQVLILLTGNYTFFNWLAILLCIPLLDDKMLRRKPAQPTRPATHRTRSWPWLITLPLALFVVALTSVPLLSALRMPQNLRGPVVSLYGWAEPFRSFNGYGLFAVMTTSRGEIVLEGSNDGRSWSEYSFKYKPGDLQRRPAFVAPYQPRLDWQMWFAALSPPGRNHWFINFEYRLLHNTPEVLALLQSNPFPAAPPKYIRALYYEYRFTTPAERRATGAWWHRDLKGLYLRPLSLDSFGPDFQSDDSSY